MDDSVKVTDCIIGFAHWPTKGPPSAVNDRLGMKLLLYRQGKPKIPAILSAGVAQYFSMPDVMDVAVVPGGVPPSIRITSHEAWSVMKDRGWKTCLVLAHEDDVLPCTAEMTKRGAIVVGVIPVVINSQ